MCLDSNHLQIIYKEFNKQQVKLAKIRELNERQKEVRERIETLFQKKSLNLSVSACVNVLSL